MSWWDVAKKAGSGAWDFITSPTGASLAGAGLGALLADDSGGSRQTTTSKTTAPDYLMPYLTGNAGVYPLTQATYLRNMDQGYIGQSPEQQALNQQMLQGLGGVYDDNYLNQGMGEAGQFGDMFGSDFSGLNLGDIRQGQGVLDPTQALQQMLSGQVDTTGLDALQQAATNRAMIGYGDAVQDYTDQFNQQIAPTIRSNALRSGNFGSSRQGIAEGNALGQMNKQMARNARDLGLASMDVGTQLYGDAYEQAQNQQYGMANALNNQGLQAAIAGQGLDLQTNAQNAQMMQAGQEYGRGILDNYLSSGGAQYGLMNRPLQDQRNEQAFDWGQLQQYLNAVHGAPGSSTTLNTPGTPAMSSLEGAGYGAMIGQGLGNFDWSFGGGGGDPHQQYYNNF